MSDICRYRGRADDIYSLRVFTNLTRARNGASAKRAALRPAVRADRQGERRCEPTSFVVLLRMN
jgi:hypothetical protein